MVTILFVHGEIKVVAATLAALYTGKYVLAAQHFRRSCQMISSSVLNLLYQSCELPHVCTSEGKAERRAVKKVLKESIQFSLQSE